MISGPVVNKWWLR